MSGGSIRDALASFAPKWLNAQAVGARFVYLFGLCFDALAEKMNQAMRMHIPTYGDVTGLPACGADRLIPQGPNELPGAYAKRLQTAYDDWQLAGSARSILRQLRGYCAPATPTVRTVSIGTSATGSNPWDSYLSTDVTTNPPSHYRTNSQNWNWDGDYTSWWRCWVIIDCSSGAPFTQPVLGSPRVLGVGNALGFSGTPASAKALAAIVGLWKPANVSVVNIILSFDSTLFDPSQPPGSTKLPNGTWGNQYKLVSGLAVPTRATAAAYLPGVT